MNKFILSLLLLSASYGQTAQVVKDSMILISKSEADMMITVFHERDVLDSIVGYDGKIIAEMNTKIQMMDSVISHKDTIIETQSQTITTYQQVHHNDEKIKDILIEREQAKDRKILIWKIISGGLLLLVCIFV